MGQKRLFEFEKEKVIVMARKNKRIKTGYDKEFTFNPSSLFSDKTRAIKFVEALEDYKTYLDSCEQGYVKSHEMAKTVFENKVIKPLKKVSDGLNNNYLYFYTELENILVEIIKTFRNPAFSDPRLFQKDIFLNGGYSEDDYRARQNMYIAIGNKFEETIILPLGNLLKFVVSKKREFEDRK